MNKSGFAKYDMVLRQFSSCNCYWSDAIHHHLNDPQINYVNIAPLMYTSSHLMLIKL